MTGLLLTSGCATGRVARRSAQNDEQIVRRFEREAAENPTPAKGGDGDSTSGGIQLAAYGRNESEPQLAPVPAAEVPVTHTLDSLEALALASNPTLRELQARIDRTHVSNRIA